ncbi:hypothetical protein OG229_15800 [Streptomyces platensis]|uniref:hypothetical protein n=1 Tax=Streptomyces platensis TaxID=58346 RepID=UPI002E137603|nr:hypothetical protein OG229_15800 [Streptomyces platensis]
MLTPDQNALKSGETPDATGMLLDFPPIPNGIDYLASVVDLLANHPDDPRALKYAVLHLHAAAEVLLKTRLQYEHWSLVFDDPRKATRRAFESGNFTSCSMAETVTRLTEIAHVTLTTKERSTLKNLGQDRNALQHYGLTHNARAIESRAGQCLDFLARFLKDELMPAMDADMAMGADITDIKRRMEHIRTYRAERRRRLRGTLKDLAHRTLECHQCGELALVIGDHCHFCSFPIGGFHPEYAADMHLTYRRIAKGGPDPQKLISRCPRCKRRAVAPDISTAASDDPSPFCFNCAAPVPSSETRGLTATPKDRP